MGEQDEQAEPGILDRLRARFGWLDHAVRAYHRFSEQNGGFYAAGLTYYTIFALFPVLMVGFAVVGFMLSRRKEWLSTIDDKIMSAVSGPMAKQIVSLMNTAIDARTSVGIIGLATAAWAGLGWMTHLRVALSEMWGQPANGDGFVRTKLSDALAMVGTFLVIMLTIALSALGQAGPMRALLKWLEIPQFLIFDEFFRVLSILVSLLVTWLLFTWMIARLPREPVRLIASMRAGLLAAVAFELFKQGASIYLRVVLRSPTGAAFGPVLGLMVFANVTAMLMLFATAWAATSHPEDQPEKEIAPPPPAVISPRIEVDEGLSSRQTAAAMAAGAVGALTLSRFFRRR